MTARDAANATDNGGTDTLAGLVAAKKPIICENQTFALCAGASCFVFNNVAYCTCDIKKCPSSDDLGHFVSVRKGGSGSSVGDVMRPAGDAASGGWRWSGV